MNLDHILSHCIKRAGAEAERLQRGELDDGYIYGRTELILVRMQIRELMNQLNSLNHEICDLRRRQVKMQQQGITITFLDPWIKCRQEVYKKLQSSLIACGNVVTLTLEYWQHNGATLKDLCNLCNRNYDRIKEETAEFPDVADNFAKLMFVYNLDYPPYEKGDFIDREVDAPFTHAVKEYMLDIMIHTPEGQKASDEALQAVFPDLWSKAMLRQVDEDGNEYFTDQEGNTIDFENGR